MDSSVGTAHADAGRRLFELLEPARPGDPLSRLCDWFLIAVILASLSAAVLWSVAELAQRWERLFDLIEVATVAVFTVELVLRIATCTYHDQRRYRAPVIGRLRFLVAPMTVIDLLAVAPFFVGLVVVVEPELSHVLPLLRVLKLLRYSPALETLGTVLAMERRSLVAATVIMGILLLLSSSLVYLVERDSQPEAFASIPDAMWWGIATLTTVGYGDVTPVTPLGKVFGSLVTVLGIAMFALPAGILATGFAQEIRQREFLTTWNLVASVPIFNSLRADQIARITRLLEPLVVHPGQVVVRQGERADRMFFVVSGELEAEVDGHSMPLGEAFFGEIALLKRRRRSATVTALTRAQLLVLHAARFEAFLDSHSELAETIRKVAQDRLVIAESLSGIRPPDGNA